MLDKIKEKSLRFKGSERKLLAVGTFVVLLGISSFMLGNNVLGWLILIVGLASIGLALLCYYVQLNTVYKAIKKDVETVKSFIDPIQNVQRTQNVQKPTNTGNRKDVTDSLKD